MRFEQTLRRAINRARRTVIGAVGHEPVVELEGAPARPRAQARAERRARMRRVALRWLRTGAAFVATLALFGLVYGVSVAWRERVILPLDPPAAATPETGSIAIAQAASLLSIDRIDPAREAWFAPASRARRARAFQAGASDAVAAFVEVVERGRAGRDKDLGLAEAALSGEAVQGAPDAVARDALRRFNARAGRKSPPIDRGAKTLAALARAAQAGVESHHRAALDAGGDLPAGLIRGEAETVFYRARGYAYAWRALLGAYGQDLPEKARAALSPQIEAAREALGEAAGYEPLILFKPPFGGQDPMTALGDDLRRAAVQARALDAVAQDAAARRAAPR